jgi:hypothetical protein
MPSLGYRPNSVCAQAGLCRQSPQLLQRTNPSLDFLDPSDGLAANRCPGAWIYRHGPSFGEPSLSSIAALVAFQLGDANHQMEHEVALALVTERGEPDFDDEAD